MKQQNELTAKELMQIVATQLRTLSQTDINDRNMTKLIAQSKEVGNLAGKAIALSSFELEKSKAGVKGQPLLASK